MLTDLKDSVNKALQLHQKGEFSQAEEIYLEVLKKSPKNKDSLNLLGMLKIQVQDYQSAILYLKKAVEVKPCSYFYANLAKAYFHYGDFDNSILNYQNALKLEPDSFDILFDFALAYKNNNQLDEAIKMYTKALEIKPKNPDVCFNLANIYERQNRTQMALEYYIKAKDYGIKYKDINYFLGVCYLKLKNFKQGWKHYEDRPSKVFAITSQELVYNEFMKTKPIWDGQNIENMKNKTIFVYYDSALGDTIMYARYLPLLVEKFKEVLFKPQQSFIDLFKHNNYGTKIIDSKILPKDVLFDYHIPLMSLPYILGLNSEEEIPFSQGYIKANKEKVKIYKEQYFNNKKIKIGIKWMGNPNYDRDRIIPLKEFYKIFELKNIQYYSLQKGDGIEEIQNLPSEYNLISLGDTFKNFTDTAAALENLDLIICNDTSVAHLAGAIGKPCWILLPFVQNWRWHNDLTYSPWYKSVKLFKQKKPRVWMEVFEEIYNFLINQA